MTPADAWNIEDPIPCRICGLEACEDPAHLPTVPAAPDPHAARLALAVETERVRREARRFVDTWLNSPPHKENLSYIAYDRTGVGAPLPLP